MALIREIVQQSIKTGYLTLTAENQLRLLLKSKYDLEDFQAFMRLQTAVFEGVVRQESRELMGYQSRIAESIPASLSARTT